MFIIIITYLQCLTTLFIVADDKSSYGGGYGSGYGGGYGRSSSSGYATSTFVGLGTSRMRTNADATNFAADVTYPGAGNFFGQQAYN